MNDYLDENSDDEKRLTEDELEEIDGIVRGEDGRLRAELEVAANAGRVPEKYW